MQALTSTVLPCYAAVDRPLARRIAEFLERGADVRVFLEEGEMRPNEDLAQKAREARVADIVLVLFSRHSLPPRWARVQWEGPLVNEPRDEGVRIAFVKCDECVPPRVLTPLFDLSETVSRNLRQIKRWVRTGSADRHPPTHGPDLEVLGLAIADRPGVEAIEDAALAAEFTRAFREDFDGILTLDCAERSAAALAGDLAAQLGLRLEGPVESNWKRLREFCEARRFLLVLYDAPEPLILEGRCSTLISPGSGTTSSGDPIREAQRALTHVVTDWPEVCRQARQGRRLLSDAGRLAECFELMSQWREAAEPRGDRRVLDEATREMVWILQGWGFSEEAQRLEEERVREYSDQMPLFG